MTGDSFFLTEKEYCRINPEIRDKIIGGPVVVTNPVHVEIDRNTRAALKVMANRILELEKQQHDLIVHLEDLTKKSDHGCYGHPCTICDGEQEDQS